MNKTIEELYYAVFTTNGDPCIIENDETAEEVLAILNDSTVEEVTDSEEFADANAKLDFSEQVPARRIYRMQCLSNPNNSGYICFGEDYGD